MWTIVRVSKGTCHKLICFRLNKIKIVQYGRQAHKQAERAETEKKIIDSLFPLTTIIKSVCGIGFSYWLG